MGGNKKEEKRIGVIFLSLIIFFCFFGILSASVTVTNVYTNPSYPTANSKTIDVYASITSDSGVSIQSAELDYRISNDSKIHTAKFSGNFPGVKATISDISSKDGLQVFYQIKMFDANSAVFWYPGPDNSGWNSFYYDSSAPIVSVTGISDYNSIASPTISCLDSYSGCNPQSFRFYVSPSQVSKCPADSSSYVLKNLLISGHSWICGLAEDNAGNVGFSSPAELKTLSDNNQAQTNSSLNSSDAGTQPITGSAVKNLGDFFKTIPGIISLVFVAIVLLIITSRISKARKNKTPEVIRTTE